MIQLKYLQTVLTGRCSSVQGDSKKTGTLFCTS